MSLNSYENEMIKVLRNSLGGEQGDQIFAEKGTDMSDYERKSVI